jgi:hypothetical protein
MDHRRGLEVLVPKFDLACHQPPPGSTRLQVLTVTGTPLSSESAASLLRLRPKRPFLALIRVVSSMATIRLVAVGGRDLHPVVAARNDDAFHLGPCGHRRRGFTIYDDIGTGRALLLLLRRLLLLRKRAAGRRRGQQGHQEANSWSLGNDTH